jgi:hypothetical protein
MRNGKLYTRFTLRTQVLFPTKEGVYSIPPTSLEMNARQAGFGAISFGNRIIRKSNSVSIKVKPLPRASMPASFTGAVGDFDIQAKLDKNSVAAGEAVNLTITFTGLGNMKDLQAPELKELQNFTIYGPELNEDVALRGAEWSGKKQWKYILVPKVAGEQKIEPLSFTYFNPKEGRYITRSTEPFNLDIKEGSLSNVAQPNIGSQMVVSQRRDINYIADIDDRFGNQSVILIKNPVIWIAALLPALANLFLFGWGFVQSKRKDNVTAYRFRRAASDAFANIKEAENYAHKKDAAKFYDNLIKAFADYFANKWNMSSGGLTIDQVRKRLEKNDSDLTKKVINFLEECEYQRFAGSRSTEQADMQKMIEDAKMLIRDLEKVVKK